MKRLFPILLISLSCSLLSAIERLNEYDLQLVKFYNSIEEHQLVIDHIDSLETRDFVSDSLYYFKAIALDSLGYDSAADSLFIDIIKSTYDDSLATSSFSFLRSNLDKYKPFDQISLVSNLITEMKYDYLRLDLMFLLAGIYEKNQLYDEANEVYGVILSEEYEDQNSIRLKIASNLIFSDKYEEAIEELEMVVADQDSLLVADGLYLLYISHTALEEYEVSLENLFTLYLDYGTRLDRLEIIDKIADTYYLLENYLMSWYFLEKLRDLDPGNPIVTEKIRATKDMVKEQNISNPFKDLIFRREIDR